MRLPRYILTGALAGALLSACGCSSAAWDWRQRHKPQETAYDSKVDEDLVNEAMGGPPLKEDANTGAPTTSSRPASQPINRSQWTQVRPPAAATKPAATRERPRDSIETPILFVNKEVITVQEVLEPLMPALEKAVKEMSLHEYNRFLEDQLRRRVARLVDEVLAYDEAKKEITEQMEPAIVKAIDQTERNRINAEFGGLFSRYQAYLEAHGQKRDDIRKRLRREMVVRQYLKDKFVPLIRPPTRQELSRYYQNNPQEFTEPLRVEMFLIDVPYWRFLKDANADTGPAMWQKLRGRERVEARRAALSHMEKARQELASGIPFDAVAKTYSFGPNRAKGGAWGPVSTGSLTGRWVEAAEVLFRLKAGELSDVIHTEEGLLLVKAGKRYEKRVIPFTEAQLIIDAKLIREQERRLEDEMLLKLRSKANVSDLPSFWVALLKAAPMHHDARMDFRLDSTIR
jgi:parvulin-like peptidyl-prolyl isomerase